MAQVKMFCPECGEELTSLGYNYDTGYIDFECPCCDWTGTDASALDEEEAMEMLAEDDEEDFGESEYLESGTDTRTEIHEYYPWSEKSLTKNNKKN